MRDLLSQGLAEMIVLRGSFIDAHALFGYRFEDNGELFAEKLAPVLRIRDEPASCRFGGFRPALTGQAILPRPLQAHLPIRRGVGGTPQFAVRPGVLGLPLIVIIVSSECRRFRSLSDLYRKAGCRVGHRPEAASEGTRLGFRF